MNQPNILLVITDQQSNRALSCADNPHLHTPHIDALAAAGVRFEQAYCAAPVCGPSRSSLVTGRLPHENGVLVNGLAPDATIPNLGELFARAGYETAWSGGWHLPDSGPEIRGFEVLHSPEIRLSRGAEGDAHVTDMAIDFLQKHRDQPFLLGVSLCNPHDICVWLSSRPAAPESDLGLPPLPPNCASDPQEPEFISQCRQSPYCQGGTHTSDWNAWQWRNYLHAYYRFVEQADAQVGRLLQALRASGLDQNTLVLFTSDHGEGMAAHRWVCKLMLYEEPVRVPFTLCWPGEIPRGVIDHQHLVSGLDVLPTLCDWAGVDFPAVTGISLRPLIENPEQAGRPFVVSQLHSDPDNLEMQGRMLRTQRYKYVAFSQGRNPQMLFDLEQDPGEMHNLAAVADSRAELDRHRVLLQAYCAQTQDPFAAAEVLEWHDFPDLLH